MKLSRYLISRLRWEHEELVKAQKILPLKIQGHTGLTYRINCFIPSIRYANPRLIRLYQGGGLLDLFKLIGHELHDADLELVSSEPVVLSVTLQVSDAKGVEEPEVKVTSELCHPHVLRRMCLGEGWTPDRSFASLLPGILDCLLFKPGTYRLHDALNPSAARYFERQSRFRLPLDHLE